MGIVRKKIETTRSLQESKLEEEIELISSEDLPEGFYSEMINGEQVIYMKEVPKTVNRCMSNAEINNFERYIVDEEDYFRDEPVVTLSEYLQKTKLKCLGIRGEKEKTEHLLSNINTEDDEARTFVNNLCKEYEDIFFREGDYLTHTDVAQHRIELEPGTKPIFTRQYRLPYQQRAEVDKQLKEMLENGIIEPSTAAWNSPIILVKKKTGPRGEKLFRIMQDFRKLNEKTLVRDFSIPGG